MALTTYAEILSEVEEGTAELQEASYPEDILTEWADAQVPVYNHHIIAEWTNLSFDDSDQWQELGVNENATIIDRMRVDLEIYYRDAYANAWHEVKAELENAAELI